VSVQPDLSATWTKVFSLLLASGILLVGIGLLFTALGLRAGIAQFSTIVTGLVMSSYFFGFIVGTTLCPALIRRAGHIRTFAALASIASTTAIVHAIAVDPWIWALLRLITGFCMVGLYMVMESWLNLLVPNASRGRVLATYVAITLGAMGVGQYLVLVGDVVGFVPLALVSILLSLALVPVALTRTPEPRPVVVPKISLRRLYENSPIGTAAALSSGLLNGAFFGMGAVFGQRVGPSEVGVAAFMSAAIFGGALLQWPVGHASDNNDRRRVLTVVCAAAAALAVLANTRKAGPIAALILCVFFYGGLVFTICGLSVALINDWIAQDDVLEAASTLLMVHGVGAVIGPIAAGLMMDAGGPGGLLVYFALVLVAMTVFGLWRLRVDTGLPIEPQQYYVATPISSPVVLEMDPRTPDAELPAFQERRQP